LICFRAAFHTVHAVAKTKIKKLTGYTLGWFMWVRDLRDNRTASPLSRKRFSSARPAARILQASSEVAAENTASLAIENDRLTARHGL
jgi:hypothetical protein